MAKKQNSPEPKLLDYTHILSDDVLEMNKGQLEGLPKNPRYIKDERYEKLKLSLETSPEFLEANPLKVYPLDNGHYIVIDGNMRLLAGRELKISEYPCYIFKEETPMKKLMEYAIKANIAYGSTDWDSLANDGWEIDKLDEWGMDVSFLGGDDGTDIDGLFEEAKNDNEKEKVTKITVSVPESMSEQVEEILNAVKECVAAYEGVGVKKA